jgi:hypothetical protein
VLDRSGPIPKLVVTTTSSYLLNSSVNRHDLPDVGLVRLSQKGKESHCRQHGSSILETYPCNCDYTLDFLLLILLSSDSSSTSLAFPWSLGDVGTSLDLGL